MTTHLRTSPAAGDKGGACYTSDTSTFFNCSKEALAQTRMAEQVSAMQKKRKRKMKRKEKKKEEGVRGNV